MTLNLPKPKIQRAQRHDDEPTVTSIKAILGLLSFQLAFAILQVALVVYAVSTDLSQEGFAHGFTVAYLNRMGYDTRTFDSTQAGVAAADAVAPFGILAVLSLCFLWKRMLRSLRVVIIIEFIYACLYAVGSEGSAIRSLLVPSILLYFAYQKPTAEYLAVRGGALPQAPSPTSSTQGGE